MTIFMYALKAAESRRQYPSRFKIFLDYLQLEGPLGKQARQFLSKAKNDPQWAEENFMLQSSQYMQFMYFIIGYHIFVLLILKIIFVKVIFVMKDTQDIFYLNKVLEMNSKHIDAFIFKGQSLYGLGNLTGAKYYFDKALEIDPNNELAKRTYNNLIKK